MYNFNSKLTKEETVRKFGIFVRTFPLMMEIKRSECSSKAPKLNIINLQYYKVHIMYKGGGHFKSHLRPKSACRSIVISVHVLMNSSFRTFLGLLGRYSKENYSQEPPRNKPFRSHASFLLNLLQLFLFSFCLFLYARSHYICVSW